MRDIRASKVPSGAPMRDLSTMMRAMQWAGGIGRLYTARFQGQGHDA